LSLNRAFLNIKGTAPTAKAREMSFWLEWSVMPKILVVDDDKQFLEMMTVRLEATGYAVIVAFDSREGLVKAKSENPDLILLDVMMPEMDGYEFCNLLKNDKRYSNIPIIICTAMVQKTELETSNKVKADATISKPFDHKILISKIEELLGEKNR